MESHTKLKLLYAAVVSPLFMFFEPYNALVKAIGLLVIVDIISGVMAAKKEGHPITSKGLFQKIPVVGLFLMALAAAKFASPLLEEFGIVAHQAGKWLCALYGVYELLSVLENLGRLGLPVAKQFLTMLRSKLPGDVQKAIDQSDKL